MPNAVLAIASGTGMPQVVVASTAAVASPHAEAVAPLFLRPPISTSTTASGMAATSADSAVECSGSSGWAQGDAMRRPLYLLLRGPSLPIATRLTSDA